MMYRIFLDLDGVLARFDKGVFDFYGLQSHYTEDKQYAWDLFSERNLNEKDFWESIDADFWANLPKSDEADEIVDLCIKAVGLDNICILTAPPSTKTEAAIFGKKQWLRHHFPQIKHVLYGSSKQFCASDTSLLVDDADKNCNTFQKAGGNMILVPRPWNTKYQLRDDVMRTISYQIYIFGEQKRNDHKDKEAIL